MKIVISIFFLVFMNFVFSQEFTNDAISLKDNIENKNFTDFYKVLSSYCKGESLTQESINTQYASNPFIKPYLVFNKLDFNIINSQTKSSEPPNTGLPTVDKLIGIFADIIVKRLKSELTIAFFDKLEKVLNDPKYPELKLIFKETIEYLPKLKDERSFVCYIKTLKDAFETDILNMTQTIPEVLMLHENELKSNEGVYILFSSIMLSKVFNKMDVFKAVDNTLNDKKYSTIFMNNRLLEPLYISNDLIQIIKLTNFQSNIENLETIAKDTLSSRMLIGLLFQKFNNREIFTHKYYLGASLVDYANSKYENMKLVIENIPVFFSSVITAINDINNIRDENDPKVRMHLYLSKSILLLKNINKLKPILNYTDKIDDYLLYADKIVEIFSLINEKKYGSGITKTAVLLESIFNKNGKYKTLFDYGIVISEIIYANNTEEIEQIIEGFLLPPGSSSIKQNANINIGINSYVGGLNGHYKFYGKNITEEEKKIKGTKWEFTTPIGFEFSTGLKKGGSISLFLSAFDIGEAVLYRIVNDTTKKIPELTFENIWAPGIYLLYGIPKVPISFGLGCQWGPPKYTNDIGISADIKRPFKYFFMMGIDLTLFNFYSNIKQK